MLIFSRKNAKNTKMFETREVTCIPNKIYMFYMLYTANENG